VVKSISRIGGKPSRPSRENHIEFKIPKPDLAFMLNSGSNDGHDAESQIYTIDKCLFNSGRVLSWSRSKTLKKSISGQEKQTIFSRD
jgi:hypothetical protein